MSVLRSIEYKIESLFEGVFGRAFRTNVQPVELARKLVKEMEDHRVISVSRVYVPNEYSVYLSPADREQFTTYEDSLIAELQDYLAENARRESYALLSRPTVQLETDEDLTVGEFGIATRMAQGVGAAEEDEQVPQVGPGATMVYKAPPGRRRLLGRRPWLDERHGSERKADQAGEAAPGGHDHARLDRPRLPAGSSLMIASVAVEEVLLLLKIVFLVLLYLFIWRIVRTASRDLRLPQESFVLAPSAAGLREEPAVETGRLVVLKSPALKEGEERLLDSRALTLGRGGQNDVKLDKDEFTSARHAKIEPRRDGVWVEDIGSTNGTYVNGARLTREQKLSPGDVVRVGETELRYET